MKKVAIDTGTLRSGDSVRGIGVHTRELIQHLKEINDPEIQVEFVNFKDSNLKNHDLVHYQKFNPYFLSLPLIKPTKTVITIHDVIYLEYPDKYPSGIKGRLKLELQKILLKRVDGVITISNDAKSAIVSHLKINPRKIHVVHLSHPDIFNKKPSNEFIRSVKEKYALPDKFVLYCGDVNYNKNLPGLISMCEIAKVRLVIIGKWALALDNNKDELEDMHGPNDWIRFLTNKPHPEKAHYKNLIKAFNTDNVIRLGYVPYEEYVAVMKLAAVYGQLSFKEGFGIGLLEAMAAGTPVICSDIAVFRETAGDACAYADPGDAKAAAKLVNKIIDNNEYAKTLKLKGLIQAKKYSWKKTANDTVSVYKKILNLNS
jgi:glycosyltransferase involved in cell wall biosynthesis